MGTRANVTLYAHTEEEALEAASGAFEVLERIEQALSDYRPSSEAMRLTAQDRGVWRPVGADLLRTLVQSRGIWEASGGAFDPTVGPLTVLWRDARGSGTRPDPDALASARGAVGFGLVEIDAPKRLVRLNASGMRLDFGGIGKGAAAGEALAHLRDAGFPSALVEIGGDLALGDAPPDEAGWLVKIETGLGQSRDMVLHNVGVATSGDAEQHTLIDGVRYSHILDPRKGEPLTTPVAVSVIDPEPWRADALASALSVLGPEGKAGLLRRFPDASAWVWTAASR